MRIIFMGTPDFALPSLNALLSSRHEVIAVVTQPDKPSSRGQIIYSPVKKAALENNIDIYQFGKIRTEGADVIRKLKPDVMVTAAYGQIIPKEIIDIPKYGIINVHASLLPKYRGSSPIQWAVINGEKETGVTIMQTNEGMDTGDILNVCRAAIGSDDTAETMFDKLAAIGASLLTETLDKIEKGEITPVKQCESEMSYFPMLKKEDGLIDFKKSAHMVDCMIRGVTSWPGAYTFYEGGMVKIHKAAPCDGCGKPGEIISVSGDGIKAACGEGAVNITELQLEGKKRITAKDAVNGKIFIKGKILG